MRSAPGARYSVSVTDGFRRHRAAHGLAVGGLALAVVDLALLHVLPAPVLHATTGALIPYRPWNFLSEYVRTQYAPLMTACFFLLAVAVLATAAVLRPSLRREAALLTLAGAALVLLGLFPTDLADLTTSAVTCGLPGRVEPCTWVGRVHNPLSTFVFVPVAFTALSLGARGRTGGHWRGVFRFALVCGVLAVCGVACAALYLRHVGWHGAVWTGLMQRSLVVPALLWMAGLLAATRTIPVAHEPTGTA
jgi:hypothetical protein